jgi:hypothetical protein
MTTNIIDNIICSAITLFFACIVMSVIDIFVFVLIAIVTPFLFGEQLHLLPLQSLMFICSVIGGITFVMLDYNDPIVERACRKV